MRLLQNNEHQRLHLQVHSSNEPISEGVAICRSMSPILIRACAAMRLV